jgi:hypothetical protein
VVVDDLDRFDRADLGFAVGSRHRQVAFDVELDRSGVHWLAVLQFDALAQRHHHALVVVDPMPNGRELPDDLEVGVIVDELVAHRGEDDAADRCARGSGRECRGSSARPTRSVVCAYRPS